MTRRHILLPLALALLAADCTVKLGLDPHARITCDTNGECPSGYTCNTDVGRCVATDRSDVSPPVVDNLTPTASFCNLACVEAWLAFDVDEPLAGPPRIAFPDGRAFELTAPWTLESRHFEVVYHRSDDYSDPQGVALPVNGLLEDLSGNAFSGPLGATVTFDFVPPTVFSPSIDLMPGPDNLLPHADLERANHDTVVRLSFVASEPLDDVTLSTVPDLAPVATCTNDQDTSFTCLLSLAAAPDGLEAVCSVQATFTDRAGNPNGATLGQFFFDTISPQAKLPLQVTLTRNPWGSESEGAEPGMRIEGALGALDPDDWAIFYGDAAGLEELGRVRANADGAFGGPDSTPVVTLLVADRADVFLRAVDSAGNASDPPTPVADVHWIATLAGRDSFDLTGNPNELVAHRWLAPTPAAVDAEPILAPEALWAEDGGTLETLGGGRWRLVSRPAMPVARSTRFASDPRSGRVFMYGGTRSYIGSTVTFNDLWMLDRDGWHLQIVYDAIDIRPSMSYRGAFAFDTDRARLVLYEPNRSDIVSGCGTWETTENMRQLVGGSEAVGVYPSGCPTDGLAVYDPAHKVTVLSAGGSLVWHWNGVRWTPHCDASPCTDTAPPTLTFFDVVYDSAAERAVLLGFVSDGASPPQATGSLEMWAWDGLAWTDLCPGGCTGTPAPRSYFSATFDPVQNGVMLTGGCPTANGNLRCGSGSGAHAYDDTWLWHGATWTCLGSTPCNTPTTGSGGDIPWRSLIFDTAREKALWSDGNIAFAWSGNAWTPTPLGSNAKLPFAVCGAAMAAYPGLDEIVLAGGVREGPLVSNQTRVWNGGWWDGAISTNTPPARFGATMAPTPASTTLLFGGSDGTTTLNDTWEWTNAGWVQSCTTVPCTSTPDARVNALMAFDPAANLTWLHGGTPSVLSPLVDVWQWTGTDWENRSTSVLPDPVSGGACWLGYGAAAAYHGLVVSTGALLDFDCTGDYFGQTLAWQNGAWTAQPLGPAPSPPRSAFGLAFDATRDKLVLFGGVPVNLYVVNVGSPTNTICLPGEHACSDTWQWDGVRWSRLEPVDPNQDSVPIARFAHAMTSAPDGSYILAFGGVPSNGTQCPDQDASYLGDTWMWEGGGRARPGHTFHVPLAASGNDAADELVDVLMHWRAGGRGSDNAGTAVDGAALWVWDVDHWRELKRDNAARPGALGTLSWRASDEVVPPTPAWPRRLFAGPRREAVFAVAPVAANGTATDYGTVVTDYVEVEVQYRRH